MSEWIEIVCKWLTVIFFVAVCLGCAIFKAVLALFAAAGVR